MSNRTVNNMIVQAVGRWKIRIGSINYLAQNGQGPGAPITNPSLGNLAIILALPKNLWVHLISVVNTTEVFEAFQGKKNVFGWLKI